MPSGRRHCFDTYDASLPLSQLNDMLSSCSLPDSDTMDYLPLMSQGLEQGQSTDSTQRTMENAGYDHEAVRTVELAPVERNGGGMICTDVCRSAHKPASRESPWNRVKCIILLVVIGCIATWLIIYITLSQMGFN